MPGEPKPLIWARLTTQGRGPARSLDYTTITRVAVKVADAEGLAALSMRKIADRLGHSPMALYRHVGSKEDLTDLMYDAALAELDLPDTPRSDWRNDLRHLALELRRLYHRHPWASRLGQRPTLGPSGIRFLEYSLSRVDIGTLDIDAMMDLVLTLVQFTQGFVTGELGEAGTGPHSDAEVQADRQRAVPYLKELLSDDRYPYFKRMILESTNEEGPDAVFERRLDMVLDGMAVRLSKLSSPD